MKYEITENGTTAATNIPPGSTGLTFSGTFSGATVTVEASFDDGETFTPVSDGAFTEAKQVEMRLPVCKLRLVTTSADGSTDIVAHVLPFTIH